MRMVFFPLCVSEGLDRSENQNKLRIENEYFVFDDYVPYKYLHDLCFKALTNVNVC